MPRDPHPPPADLDSTARAMYREMRQAKRDQGTWRDVDRYLLAATCRAAQRAREIRAAVGDELLVKGSRGQLVANPRLREAEAAERAFVDGLRDLALTPVSRKRLELEVQAQGSKFGFLGD